MRRSYGSWPPCLFRIAEGRRFDPAMEHTFFLASALLVVQPPPPLNPSRSCCRVSCQPAVVGTGSLLPALRSGLGVTASDVHKTVSKMTHTVSCPRQYVQRPWWLAGWAAWWLAEWAAAGQSRPPLPAWIDGLTGLTGLPSTCLDGGGTRPTTAPARAGAPPRPYGGCMDGSPVSADD